MRCGTGIACVTDLRDIGVRLFMANTILAKEHNQEGLRTAILLSSPLDTRVKEKVDADLIPRPDYLALVQALHADIIAPVGQTQTGRGLTKANRIFKAALAAFHKRNEYDLIITDLDRTGLVLASLL